MPLKTVRVPSYRRHKGTGQAFVQVKGQRYYLGKHGTPESEERYRRFIAEMMAGPAGVIEPEAGHRTANTILVVQVVAAFWKWAEGYYLKDGSPTGHRFMVHRALAILRTMYGSTLAADFGPRSFRAIQQRLVRDGSARGYINSLCGVIRRVFKWAASQELVPVTVYQTLATVPGLKRGRTEARETQPVSPVADHVVDATLPHLPRIVADMVRLQRFTGCRPGEVVQVRPQDVDRTGAVWVYRPESHKTQHHGRERIVFIGPRAQDVLRPYLLRPADAYCFSPSAAVAEHQAARHANRKTPLSCGNRPGSNRKAKPKRSPQDHYVKDSYNRAIARGVAKANLARAKAAAARGEEPPAPLPNWHPNQLRHSAATEIRKAFGLEAAQVIPGHAKADVTQVYAERDQAVGIAVAAKMG